MCFELLVFLINLVFIASAKNHSIVEVLENEDRKYNFSLDGIVKILPKRPEMPQKWKDRLKRPFNPAWMDYCDPYHCNDYHKTACGLNREQMRYRWFQSGCHIALNNLCASYRGSIRYDAVDTIYCLRHVMFLRNSRQIKCDDSVISPVCGRSLTDGHFVVFSNRCFLDARNSKLESLQEYTEVDMKICQKVIAMSI